MRLRIKNTNLTLKLIAWFEIIGGTIGLGVIAYLMTRTGTVTGAVLLLLLIGITLFGFSIYCGRKIIADPTSSYGIVCSLINQFLQLIQWAILGYKLTFASGLAITIGVQNASFVFNIITLASTFEIAINSDPEFYFKVNLAALFLIIILFDILSERKKDKYLVVPEPADNVAPE